MSQEFVFEFSYILSIYSNYSVVDLHSKIFGRAPPSGGPNSFNFMQFSGKIGKIICWRPPGELAPPPRGNPGSATVITSFFLSITQANHLHG